MKANNARVKIVNLGCSKNQVDSENILRDFHNEGYEVSESSESDIIVVNTCGFIESAKEESIGEIMDLVRTVKDNQKIVVAGCLSERYMSELKAEIPEVKHFFGTYKSGEISKNLKRIFPPQSDCKSSSSSRIFLETNPHHAYLKIAEGCNRVCSFCAIPQFKGKQKSRSIKDIITEARDLQKMGILELSLIAQDLTFFGREKSTGETLAGLIKALLKETDIPWIRLMYAYPAFLDEEMIQLFVEEKRLCNYLDIPIQHVNNKLLKTMRRGYTKENLETILRNLKGCSSNIALRTTVLLGYPGETEKDFNELLDFIEEFRFDRLGGFTYSDEDKTYAFEDLKAEPVDEDVAKERLDKVMFLQQQISLELNQAKVGKEFTVIIDEHKPESTKFPYIGRTEHDAPEVDNNILISGEGAVPATFRKVRVTNALEFDLEAELIGEN